MIVVRPCPTESWSSAAISARFTARSRSARSARKRSRSALAPACAARQFATLRASIATMTVSRTATTWLSHSSIRTSGGATRTALAVAIRKAAPITARCCHSGSRLTALPSATSTGKRKKLLSPSAEATTYTAHSARKTASAYLRRAVRSAVDPMTATMRIAKPILVGAIPATRSPSPTRPVSTALPIMPPW